MVHMCYGRQDLRTWKQDTGFRCKNRTCSPFGADNRVALRAVGQTLLVGADGGLNPDMEEGEEVICMAQCYASLV